MSSLRHWLTAKVWPIVARRFLRLDEAENYIATSGERYLDASSWASIRGIEKGEAEEQLQHGVARGHLEQCFLYEWPDSPVRFVVPGDLVGQSVRLADVGYIGEDDDRSVVISPSRVRTVFVASHHGI